MRKDIVLSSRLITAIRFAESNGLCVRPQICCFRVIGGNYLLQSQLTNMPDIKFNLENIVDEYECLAYPVVFWRGRLSVLAPTPEGGPHQFGGPLPNEAEIPTGAVLHLLLSIDTTQCSALEGIGITQLPLIFPFRHDGGRIRYHYDKNKVTVAEVTPSQPGDGWPYGDYPDVFSPVKLGSSSSFDLSRNDFEELLSQQLRDTSDEKVVVVIPPREDYGVSLWGEMGDAEMVQCVFVFDPATGEVTAENQCS